MSLRLEEIDKELKEVDEQLKEVDKQLCALLGYMEGQAAIRENQEAFRLKREQLEASQTYFDGGGWSNLREKSLYESQSRAAAKAFGRTIVLPDYPPSA